MQQSSTSSTSQGGLPFTFMHNPPPPLYQQQTSNASPTTAPPSTTPAYPYPVNPHPQAYSFNASLARQPPYQAPLQAPHSTSPSFVAASSSSPGAPLSSANSSHSPPSLPSLSNATSISKQIHRTRPSYSCVLCRQRRVKCDRAKPSCGKCVKMGVQCQWSLDNPEVYNHVADSEARGVKRMRSDAEFSRQDGQRERGSKSPTFSRENSTPTQNRGPNGATSEKDLKASLERLTEVLEVLKNSVVQNRPGGDQQRLPPRDSVSPPQARDLGETLERTRAVVEENMKSLNLDAQGVGCGGLGDKFWEHISTEITGLRDTLNAHKANGTLPQTKHDIPYASLYYDDLKRTDLSAIGHAGIAHHAGSEVQRCLPHKNQCDMVITLFFQNIHPLLTILHYQTFMEQYDEFWTLHGSIGGGAIPQMPSNPAFVALLFAVLYSVTAVAPADAIKEIFLEDANSAKLMAQFKFAATRYLDDLDFWSQPTITSLQAYLVLNFDSTKDIRRVVQLIWTSMRAAYHLRLFQDGRPMNLGVVEVELRRRLWWYLVHWDVEVAIVTGAPPIASADEACNTGLPSILKDSLISNDNAELYYADPSSYTPGQVAGYMIYHTASFEMGVLRKKIIRRLHAVQQPSKKDLEDLGIEIFTARKEMADKIKQIPLDVSIPNFWEQEFAKDVEHQLTLNRYSRVMISALADRTYTLLYQPFLKSTRGKLWNHTRGCALRACHAFMRKFIYLRDNPIFEHLRWTMTIACPIQPITIVLIDLHARPFSAESTRSRVLSDACFALVERIQPWTKDWEMLKRLRAKAYERAGVSADVIGSDKNWNVSKEDVDREIEGIDRLLDGDFKCPAELSMLQEEMLVRKNQLNANARLGPGISKESTYSPMSDKAQKWKATWGQSSANFNTFGDWGVRKQLMYSNTTPSPKASTPQANGSPYDSSASNSGSTWSPRDVPSVTSGETLETPDGTHRGSSSIGCDSNHGTSPAHINNENPDGAEPMDTSKEFAWDEWDNMFGQYIDLGEITDWDKKHSPFWSIHSNIELV
ncbi:hypothetical protein BJ508DRAFT_410436 [Ascobolus immersus RN42]|uniref:Zn(2)-C6 fungal-type domain-containing protein n=1 Tax=Ascobolus immersus RN42 TaxID=1160509 RepID=A0A3N4J198_ASCIM|nr:hypothetical protein BJ508DRAFT_410436 [Ascobolus immersus RN42]